MKLLVIFILYALALTVALARAGYRARKISSLPAPGRKRISRVLIIGATGGTGRELVAQALERGYEVTALARDPAKLQINSPQLTVVRGDVLDYDSIARAMRDQDAVLSALGHNRYFYPTRILSDGTRNILRAMAAQGAMRFVCETSLGIGDSAGRMGLFYTFFIIPLILPFYFWDKAKQERIIAESEVDWTIVRPGALRNSKGSGRYRSGARLGSFIQTRSIARADVAAFMLEQLETEAFFRSAVSVTQ